MPTASNRAGLFFSVPQARNELRQRSGFKRLSRDAAVAFAALLESSVMEFLQGSGMETRKRGGNTVSARDAHLAMHADEDIHALIKLGDHAVFAKGGGSGYEIPMLMKGKRGKKGTRKGTKKSGSKKGGSKKRKSKKGGSKKSGSKKGGSKKSGSKKGGSKKGAKKKRGSKKGSKKGSK